jgi:hypothetical protein
MKNLPVALALGQVKIGVLWAFLESRPLTVQSSCSLACLCMAGLAIFRRIDSMALFETPYA